MPLYIGRNQLFMDVLIYFIIASAIIFPILFIANIIRSKKQRQVFQNEISALENKLAPYQGLIELDAEIQKRKDQLKALYDDIQELKSNYSKGLVTYDSLQHEIKLYQEDLELNEYGLYKPIFSFKASEDYKAAIERNYRTQKEMMQSGDAAICGKQWQIEGSLTEGRKMTKQAIKLMLLAFNGECDSLISKVRWNNANKIIERIRKAYENVNKQGSVNAISITPEFLDLKLKELALTYEHELKLYEEKEEQRRIREQMREEEKAAKEFEKAQREAEDEERKYEKALEKAKKDLGIATETELDDLNLKIKELEARLAEAHDKKERALSMAQQTKVGHIYVISNIGSFGEDVFKIGMTRRLDPVDRIKELGDASVPFQFDIHAIIFSENAPQLEYELHRAFDGRRINRVNGRKEFFKVSLDEIEEYIVEKTKATIQFTKLAEAKEYRETITLLASGTKQPVEEIQKFPIELFQ